MRERKLIIATGQRGIGKSYTTFWKYLIPAVVERKQKVLIIDVNDEYGKLEPNDDVSKKYTDGKKVVVRAILPEDVAKFSRQLNPEIRRVRNFNYATGRLYKKDELLQVVENVIEDFRGGLLLMEDIVAMMGNNMAEQIMSLIARNRHFDLDVIIHLQSVAMILPRLYQASNYIRYHKQLDTISKSKNKLVDLLELFTIAEYIVDEYYYAGNKRYFVWINIDDKKIVGDFDKETFKKCVTKYLSQNTTEMKYLLNERDSVGKKKFTYEQAFEEKKNQLISIYCGV